MNRPLRDHSLVPSLLDRLIDDGDQVAASVAREDARLQAPAYSEEDFLRDIRRDLSDMLNTRRTPLDWESRHDILLSYGVPDHSRTHMGSADVRRSYALELQRLIARLDSRFQNPKVTPIEEDAETSGVLRFRIQGTVRADPDSIAVDFESRVETTTQRVSVERYRRA